jgi:RND family efflux transporter MFP subunit
MLRGPLEKGENSNATKATQGTEAGERRILYWHDPMHPQYRSDRPGKAPDCGMDLVPVYADEAPAAAGERKVLYWIDPMHPEYKSDKPGKAPDCGMDLMPVYDEGSGESPDLPESAFHITTEKQQLIGVQFGEARVLPMARSILASAQLAYDETRIVHVHSRFEGWIEQVFVDFTGKPVRKGQPLLAIYSPELLATQEEYLLALKARDRLGDSRFKEVSTGANSLLEAARRRLELWNVSEAQIAELEKSNKPIRAVTLQAPRSGFILTRNAYEQQKITADTELYSIADLTSIWAVADIYEFEAADVRVGQAVTMTVQTYPGRTYRGKVSYIYPQLDVGTRTLKVRADFANPDHSLKPDMWANIELKVQYGRRLAVPREAVLDSGTEQIVFISLGNGFFEPRKVQLGARVGNDWVVLSGLQAGDKVVTSGNFLIDSESRLQAATGAMSMPGMSHRETQAPQETPKPEHHGHD